MRTLWEIRSERTIRGLVYLFVVCAFAIIVPASALGQGSPMSNRRPNMLRDVGIDQKLDSQVPLDLTFRDEQGKQIKLADYFNGKPVVLVLAYYECPMLCTQVLNGVTASLKTLSFDIGKDFNVITVSFNPRELPQLAAAKKATYIEWYNRPGAAEGWHFLTGDPKQIDILTKAVGFRYQYDSATGQYAHASGIMLLTPDGRVARYLYGIDYSPKDLRLGLVEASEGKIGSAVDQVLLFCYHYDPVSGKYSAMTMNSLRIGAILTMIGLVAFIAVIRRRRQRGIWPKHIMKGAHLSVAPIVFFFTLPFMPEQASSVADKVDNLYLFLVALTLFVSITIALCEIYFAVRFRRRSKNEIPEAIEGSLRLELLWTITPFIIAMFIFVWGASVFFTLYHPPAETMDIYATGKQWMWRFQHPEGQREINELHVPVGRRIKLTMATEDVIHAFFVPDFRVKADIVPGRYTTAWFEAIKPGRYHLFCAEYCGTNHSGMGGWVIVMEPAEYQAWLSGGAAEGSLSAAGQRLFQDLACVSCHKADGTGRGPALEGQYGKPVHLDGGQTVTFDDTYIRESILNSNAKIVSGYAHPSIMPTFQGLVNEEQLLQLIAYLKSIGPQQSNAGGAQTAPVETKQQPGPQQQTAPANAPKTAKPTPRP